MNCISNLAKKNLKAYKTRNILTILAVILSTCLITAIGILGYSIQQMTVDVAIKSSGGNYHGIYKTVNEKQFDILRNNRKIEEVGKRILFKSIKSSNPAYPEILLEYVDLSAAKMSNMEIQNGKLPSKRNDIALESWVLHKMKIKPKVGQTVHTPYGDFILSAVLKDNPQNKENKSFTAGAVSKSFIMENVKSAEVDAYVRIKRGENVLKEILDIGSKVGIDNKDIIENTMYIKSMGLDFGIILPVTIVGIVVVLSAVMVIYNIFYISTVGRVRDFGLLRAVGTTKKQIKKIILKEGILLSAIGIPIGILIGYAVSFSIIPLFSVENLKIKSSFYIVIISIVVSLITIVISLSKPRKFASKISPVEAIGYNEVKIGGSKKERSSLKKVSVLNMSYLNLWRNKKRTIMTIISLSMSGILFAVVCSILLSMNVNNMFKQDLKYEFKLESYIMDENPMNNKMLQDIRNIDGVKNVNTDVINFSASIKNSSCIIYGYNDAILDLIKNKVAYGELSIEELKNKNKIILIYDDKRTKCPYKVGDKIKLNFKKFDKGKDKGINVSEDFIISGIVNKNFSGATKFVGRYSFITHEDVLKKLLNKKDYDEVFISIDKNKFEEVRSKIRRFVNNNNSVRYSSIKEEIDKSENQYRGIEVASLSLVGIIVLIGILNLINTTITSIFSRKKEFGMLQAIGLSSNQLTTMLQLEGIYYAVISIAITMTLGTSLGYLCFRLFKNGGANYAEYKSPIIPLLLFSLVLMVLEILLAFVTQKLLRKESIVDRIKYSE